MVGNVAFQVRACTGKEVMNVLLYYEGQQIALKEDENQELVNALQAGEFPGLAAIRIRGRAIYVNLSEHVPFSVQFTDSSGEFPTPVGVRSDKSVGDMKF